MLKGLSHERGLPAGEQEVLMIEHAQKKHKLEASLPPATDEASLGLRRKLLELQEMREFRLRQREMDEAHEERLDLLRQALVDRDQDNEFLAEQRVEALRQRQIEERDRSVEQIQSQRIKVLRKLSMARGRLQMPASEPPGSKRRSVGDRRLARVDHDAAGLVLLQGEAAEHGVRAREDGHALGLRGHGRRRDDVGLRLGVLAPPHGGQAARLGRRHEGHRRQPRRLNVKQRETSAF